MRFDLFMLEYYWSVDAVGGIMAANDNSAGQQSSGSQNGTLGSLDSTNQGAADSRENKPGKEPWWEWLKPFRLLLIPFILLLISAYFQVSDTLENTQKISIERTAIVTSQVDGELVLHIAAPADLDYQEPGNAKAPLSVWLSYASPYPSPTPTFNGPTATSMPVSPTPTQNAVGGAVVTSTEAPPTATPTAYSYLLNLGVSWDAITFTDKDGRSVSGQIALTPSRFGVTPEVLYLQLNANSPNVALTIVPSIRDANGFQILPAFSVEPETKNAAWWRLFLSLTLTPTLIGTLLVTVTTLAIQQWGKAEDDRAKKKKEEDNERIIRKNTLDELEKKQRAQVESLTTLIKEKPADAARLYLGFMKLCENKDRVKAAWAAASEELKNLVELEYASRDEKELTNLIYKLGQEKVEQALKHAIQHRLDEEWENRADVIAQAVFRQKPEYWEGQLLSYLFAIDRP
ncbi:MAG: hypothetical protein L6461_17640, partial [Anaerolineae bacterium]|nr:hypothetical protein [Anaerolineae bacterium]